MRQYEFTIGTADLDTPEQIFIVWASNYKIASAKVRRLTGAVRTWASGGDLSREVKQGTHIEVSPA